MSDEELQEIKECFFCKEFLDKEGEFRKVLFRDIKKIETAHYSCFIKSDIPFARIESINLL